MHDSYPQPGCSHCEALARSAGHASVAAYLRTQEAQVIALPLSDMERVAA